MLPKEYQGTSSFNPTSRNRCNFLREPGKSEGLVDMPDWILVCADATWDEELQTYNYWVRSFGKASELTGELT
jgi:hypothetical protein